MRGILARAATAATIVALTSTGAAAASARVIWEHPGDAGAFRLFVAQVGDPDAQILDFIIQSPAMREDGTFVTEVSGLDALLPTFFLLVAIGHDGGLSEPSNIIELGSEGFCEAFDIDGDGRVTTVDALAVARKSVGLGRGADIDVEGSIVTALEILRLAATFECR